MRRGAPISAREALELILQLPDTSAFMSSLKANAPAPDDGERAALTAEQQVLRRKRQWRSWSQDTSLLGDVRDLLAGAKSKPYPRPWQDGAGGANRKVMPLENLPNF